MAKDVRSHSGKLIVAKGLHNDTFQIALKISYLKHILRKNLCRRLLPNYKKPFCTISIDGSKLEDFPDARHNNGIAEAWSVKQRSALFMVNPENQHIVPISYGLVSMDEIEERIVMLFRTIPV